MAHGVTLQIYRTATPGTPPPANTLAQGELAVEMASTPPKLWVGVPTSVAASGQVQLNAAPASIVTSFNTRSGAVTLSGVDISGAGGALLAGPAFTGTPTAPTATTGTSTTQLATTAFVQASITAIASGVTSFNTRTGAVTLSGADLTGAGGALLVSPTFSGTPAAPTATPGTSTTQLATTAFVAAAISGVGGGVSSVTGTANQILATTTTGAVTLSLIGPYTPATFATHGLLIGEGTSAIAGLAAVAPGRTLISNGAAADPSWSATLPLGNAGSTTGLLSLTTNIASSGTVTLQSAAAAYTNYTFQFPSGAPSNGSLLMFSGGVGATAGLADVATGQVLTSGGATAIPVWSATPTVAGLTATTTVTFPDGTTNVTAGANNGSAGYLYGFQNATGLAIGTARSAGGPPTGGNVLMLGQTQTPCIFFQPTGFQPVASIQYASGVGGYFDIAQGAYYNGSAWIATLTNAMMIGFTPVGPSIDFFVNIGLTAASSFTVNKIMSVTAGGLLTNGSYQSNILGATQIYLGGTGAGGAAATLTSVVANNFNLAAGAYYSSSAASWVANATNPLVYSGNGGSFQWYVDTGKTVGLAYSPSMLASLDTTNGLLCNVGVRATAFFQQGAGIPAGTYWQYNAGGSTNSSTFVTSNTITWNMRPSDWLDWNPAGAVGGLGAYQNISDIRFKSNIAVEERGLEVIRQLQPIVFQRSTPDGKLGNPEIGFSAQDVRPVLPEAVSVIGSPLPDGTGGLDSADPTLAITYDAIFTVLVNAVKQLDQRLTAAEAKA